MKSKSICILLFCLLFNSQVRSQIIAGGGILYGEDIEEAGINLRAYTFIGDRICFGPELTLFNKHKTTIGGESAEIGLWEVNFNGHYIFEIGEGLGVYPLTGINFSREIERVEGHADVKEAVIGINAGFGAHYEKNKALFYVEYDRLISDLGQNSFTIGVLFHLGKKGRKSEGQ